MDGPQVAPLSRTMCPPAWYSRPRRTAGAVRLAPLAQLAEQQTLNLRVRGSSPWRRTRLPYTTGTSAHRGWRSKGPTPRLPHGLACRSSLVDVGRRSSSMGVGTWGSGRRRLSLILKVSFCRLRAATADDGCGFVAAPPSPGGRVMCAGCEGTRATHDDLYIGGERRRRRRVDGRGVPIPTDHDSGWRPCAADSDAACAVHRRP